MIEIWIDGAARPNPGTGGIGVVIRGDNWDYTISEACQGRVSNNQAEYKALVRALSELVENRIPTNHEILIFSDSEMLVEQMCKRRQVARGGAYVPDYIQAMKLKLHFNNLSFQYIPREENAEADMLASKGTRKKPL